MTSPPPRGWARLQTALLAEIRAYDKRTLHHIQTTRVTNLLGEQTLETHPEWTHNTLTPEDERLLKLRAQQKLALMKGHDRAPVRITNRLYIGSGAAAKNLKALRKAGITHILNATMVVPCYYKDTPEKPSSFNFTYMSVPVFDDEDTDLVPYLDSAVDFIEAGRAAGGVLVHCCAGQSRSAALIMAYFIAVEGMQAGEAWAVVRRSRPCAHPNQGFLRQLAEYERAIRFETTTPFLSRKSSSFVDGVEDDDDVGAACCFPVSL